MTAPAVVPLFHTTDRGWFQFDGKGPKHWGHAEEGVACGLPAPEHTVPCLGDGPVTRADLLGACPRCVTALVTRQHQVPFKVGDRVTSHEMGMTIHGTVRRVFLDDDGVPHLDLTRFWVTEPRDPDDADERKQGADHWYRTASTCTPYQGKETAMTTATKPARKPKASPVPAAAEAAPKKASGRGRKVAFATEYHPGQFVAVQEGPRTFRMGVIMARDGEQYSAHFQEEAAPRTGLAFNDLGPRVMNTPAAPLRPGDSVEGQAGSGSKLLPGTGPWVVDEIKNAKFVHVRNPAGEIRGEAVADLALAQRQSVTDALIDLAILPSRDELEVTFPVGTPVTFTRDGEAQNAVVWAVLSEDARHLRAGDADVLLLVQWAEWNGTEIGTEAATFSQLALREAPPLPRPGDVVQGFAKDGPIGVFRGGVITVRPDEAHVFLVEGSVKIHPHLLAPALLDADGVARPGDVVMLSTRPGRWEVTRRSALDDHLELRNTETGEEVAGQPNKGFRVAHRASLADLCRDLQRPSSDLPAGEPAAAQEDLPFPVSEAELDVALGIDVEPETRTFDCPECTSAVSVDTDTCSHCGLRFQYLDDVPSPAPDLPGILSELPGTPLLLEGEAAGDHSPPTHPFQEGDLIEYSGERRRILQLTASGALCAAENDLNSELLPMEPGHPRFGIPLKDLVQATLVTAAPTEGWVFPGGSHLGHWGTPEKVLCGRSLPAGVKVFGTDPLVVPLTGKACRKCAKALAARPAAAAPELTAVETVPVQPLPAEPKRAFPIPEIEPLRTGLQEVPWNKILPWEHQPRKHFDQVKLVELAVNIHRKGLRQNVQLRPHPDRPGMYQIAAGERRWRAIGLLVKSLEVGDGDERETLTVEPDYAVAARVDELTDLEMLELAMAENLKRGDMTPLEIAGGYAGLIDQGRTVAEVAAMFGEGKRRVQRMVDISRNLHGEARAMYDAGKLPLATAEVLALAPHAVQDSVWKSRLRHGQVALAEVRQAVMGHLFVTANAKFPREWYDGKVAAADLFGDLPEHFVDFDQAIRLQVRHAKALAEQDVRQGQAFADVRLQPEVMAWKYWPAHGEPGGVMYWVNARTGELERRTNLRRKPSEDSDPIELRLDAPQPVPTHEHPERPTPAAATTPAAPAASTAAAPPSPPPAPAQADYARPFRAHNAYLLQVLPTLTGNRAALHALFLADFFLQGNLTVMDDTQRARFAELVRLTDGLLVLEGGEFGLFDEDQGMLPHAVPVLASLPLEHLEALVLDAQLETVRHNVSADDLFSLRRQAGLPGFQMTEEYLEGCNAEALAELWDDACLGDRSAATPGMMRARLLAEAPSLAVAGFLPRPLREQA